MTNIIDQHPQRFGWRWWRLDDTGTRLLSPIHKGAMNFGRSFAQADCTHTSDPFALATDCSCGIYFYPHHRVVAGPDEFAESMRRRTRTSPSHVVLTFGVAVGAVFSDPVIPDIASRTRRWRILAMALPTKSATAGELQQRYGVNVHQGRPFTAETVHYIEAVARAELRNHTADQYFDSLRHEPVWATEDHILDTHPTQFGWRIWHLQLHNGRLASPFFRDWRTVNKTYFTRSLALKSYFQNGRRCFEAECAHGNTLPSPNCHCGITYAPSAYYLMSVAIAAADTPNIAEAGYLNVPWAYTFGFTSEPGLGCDINTGPSLRAKRYTPLTILIPTVGKPLAEQPLADMVKTRHGNVDLRLFRAGRASHRRDDVIEELYNTERHMRAQLAGTDPHTFFNDGSST